MFNLLIYFFSSNTTFFENINRRLTSIENTQKTTTERIDNLVADKKSTMDEILQQLKLMQSGVRVQEEASTSRGLHSSADIPPLEDIQGATTSADQMDSDSNNRRSPVFTSRVANKRKATSSHEEDSNETKKLKIKHKRTKSSTPAERQAQRNQFTRALTVIPDWFPDTWNFAAYITNRFYWVHEAARFEMYKVKKTKGQNYPCYRVPFNNFAISLAKEYDNDRKVIFEANTSNPDLALVNILPWYKLHSPAWKRPMIHPRTAKTSTEEFAFHTNIEFMDNFLDDLGGKHFIILYYCNYLFPMRIR